MTSLSAFFSTPGQTSPDAGPWTLLVLVAVACAASVLLVVERRRVRDLEKQLTNLRSATASPHPPESVDPRGQIIFEQHRRMNDLQIAKLTAELELLRRQVDRKDEDADRIAAGKEVHELMVEKTRLEIDGLRLQLVEMRKRTEDWGHEP